MGKKGTRYKAFYMGWFVWRPKLSHNHFTIRVTYPDNQGNLPWQVFRIVYYQGNLPCCPGNLPGQRDEAASLGSAFVHSPAGGFTMEIHHASEGGRLH